MKCLLAQFDDWDTSEITANQNHFASGWSFAHSRSFCKLANQNDEISHLTIWTENFPANPTISTVQNKLYARPPPSRTFLVKTICVKINFEKLSCQFWNSKESSSTCGMSKLKKSCERKCRTKRTRIKSSKHWVKRKFLQLYLPIVLKNLRNHFRSNFKPTNMPEISLLARRPPGRRG